MTGKYPIDSIPMSIGKLPCPYCGGKLAFDITMRVWGCPLRRIHGMGYVSYRAMETATRGRAEVGGKQ